MPWKTVRSTLLAGRVRLMHGEADEDGLDLPGACSTVRPSRPADVPTCCRGQVLGSDQAWRCSSRNMAIVQADGSFEMLP